MKTICGNIAQLMQRIGPRGATLESIAPAILSRDGDLVCVDVDDTAYPKPLCRKCDSNDHCTADCPLPDRYDGNYRLDSKGSAGCNCAGV